jgi:hypothetical protein
MANADVSGIVKQLFSEATKVGGDTWKGMQKSAPLYFRGYAQALADIAEGVAAGEISQEDAELYIQNARLVLAMSIANTTQLVLFQVQSFMDKVLGVAKGAINSRLPVALL